MGRIPFHFNNASLGLTMAGLFSQDYNDQTDIAAVLAKSKVPRSKLFVTSKIPPSHVCTNASVATTYV